MELPSVVLDTDRLPPGPWIYARQVRDARGAPDGSLVEVLDDSGRFVGHALHNGKSDIRLRMLSRGKRHALDKPDAFLREKLSAASRIRRKTLRLPLVSNAWRLCHGEGDDLSGLIVDRFADVFVAEYHSLAFWNLRGEVEKALYALDKDASVVHRVPAGAFRAEGFPMAHPDDEPGLVEGGDGKERWITEHGIEFPIRPGHGHKTGWFCDQRDNRQRVASFAAGRDVLDLCCNAGGFALACARAGARSVTAVDLDEVVLERASRAGARAGLDVDFRHQDAFDALRASVSSPQSPQLIVLDPHKLISGKRQLETGRIKYLDFNTLALQAAAPGGLVATFSCSGALDLPAFLGVIFQSARRADREIRLLELMGAAPDHPQRPEFPRSRYLKGALIAVD